MSEVAIDVERPERSAPGPEQPAPDHRRQSRRPLDALSFFVADAQTGFGPYIASYLAGQGWTSTDIGNALGIGTLSALFSQLPAGALVDRLHDKRRGAAAAWIAMAAGAVLFAVAPTKIVIYLAEVLHSFSTSMLAPAVAAISLALVGRKALGERLGRNARFAAIGNGATAALLGAAGKYLSARWVFWITAGFVVPGVLLLFRLPHPRQGPGQPDASEGKPRKTDLAAFFRDLRDLLRHRSVWAFAICVALFHLGNAALLPIASIALDRTAGANATLFISACVVGPQILVAVLSPSIGRSEERYGVRWILMAGYAAVPVRAACLALATSLDGWTPYAIVAAELFDGISGAVFGVSLPIMAADLTRGSNRFNLCLGFLGIASTAGATLGNMIGGRSADGYGIPAAMLMLGAGGLLAVGSVYLTVPDGAGKTRGRSVRHYLKRKRHDIVHRYRERVGRG